MTRLIPALPGIGFSPIGLLIILALFFTGCEEGSSAPKLLSISVVPDESFVRVTESQQYAAAGTYSDGSVSNVTFISRWASDQESVATVDGVGFATGVGAGTSAITATVGGVTGTAQMVVGKSPDAPSGGANLGLIVPSPVTTAAGYLSVSIPQQAESIGIVALGTNTNFKFIDHGLLLTGPQYILGPDGLPVPLSFNMIDLYDTGTEEPLGDNLVNRQAVAVFFPNDGDPEAPMLEAGIYQFPIGSIRPDLTDVEEDTFQTYIFYKTSTAAQQTMTINLWVADGVNSNIDSQATAGADPEIQGAIQTLRNVYQERVGLNLQVNLAIIPSSFVVIETEEEQDLLLRSYPLEASSDALNLFIIGQLTYIDGGGISGVIGLSAGIPGPFNLHGTVVSGTLAEYQGDDEGYLLGFTLAHEFGHFLGLWHTSQTDERQRNIIGHDPVADTGECTTEIMGSLSEVANCPDRFNLMFPIADNASDPSVTTGQIKVLLLNPGVFVP